MTYKNKELRKLSRAELLELLLEQTQEVERLQQKLAEAEAALNNRHLKITAAGDLAHAVLDINGVTESVQAAAQQYLENISEMERQAKERCAKMLEEAEQEVQWIREHGCFSAEGVHIPEDSKRTEPGPEKN